MQQWHRLALGRLVDALAAGEITAWAGDEQIPSTWWRSDIELDLRTGALYGPNDRHRPLATGLQLYREDDKPAVVAAREAVVAAGGHKVVITQAIAEHRAELASIPHRDAQVAWLSERLPGVSRAAMPERLREAFGDFPKGGTRGPGRRSKRVPAEPEARRA